MVALCDTRAPASPHHEVLKSLVFAAGDDFVIVVVSGSGRVDARKLASLLGVKRAALRLAPPDAAAAVTGYAIGTIPPLGHATRLRTVLDAAVLACGPDAVLFAGGGGAATQLEISAAELLRACAAEVGDVLQGRAPHAAAALAADAAAAFPEEALLGAYAPALTTVAAAATLDQRMAPARPLRADLAAVLGAPLAGAVAAAELVMLEATIVRVRRMGRLLLFATLAAPHVPAGDSGGAAVASASASAALPAALLSADGAPAALQAIAGRTLAAALGEDAAAALLGVVRAGARVRVAGRPQANPRPGCVDIVVAELTVLSSAVAELPAALPAATDDALTVPDADDVEAKDPDAWLFADGEEDEDGAADGDGDEDDELAMYANACGDGADAPSDTDAAAGAIAWTASSSSRRRSSPRRGSFAAPMTPLHAFALSADIAVSLVATAADVAAMSAAVCDPSSTIHAPLVAAADAPPPPPLPAAVGIDAEWRPYERGGAATPVALLQLATRRAVFLVDVLALSGTPGGLSALDAFLRELLPSEKVLKLGFGLQHDLSRLASSYDKALTFGAAAPPRALLELRGAAAVAAPDALPWLPHPRRLAGVGLASLTRLVLRAELDKRAQLSDWGARPLLAAQAAYAAADAAVLCALFDSLMARSAKLRAKLPFLLDAPPGRAVFGAPPRGGGSGGKGSGSSARGAPPRGDKVALGEVRVSVDGLLSNFLGVPLPGKGRDAALAAAAAGAPDGGRPRGAGGCRGGVLECANAALLFMNAEPIAGKRYPNEFWRRARDGALMVSWFGGPGQHEGTPQVARLMGGGEDGEDGVLLFVRMPRGPYVCCGRLVCEGTGDADEGDAAPAGSAAAKGLLRLRMRLVDAAPLCGSAHFASLLSHAQGEAGLALLARR
jgi:prolyl-tRNA editing enzyme YbaK/EbsC (Cys-tRNA(Pro) deacylase)